MVSADDYANGPEPEWIVDGVLPAEGIAMIVGASGSGKTFVVIDMISNVSLSIPWRGLAVKQKRVVYIAAEGAAGLRKRLRAYKHQHGVKFGENFNIISDAPNLLSQDHVALADIIKRSNGAGIIVIDTLAQTTAGGDENASVDMGKALRACAELQKATGALIILVHHHGKDASKGARGWSGLKAAMDTEIEITQQGQDRYITVTKQKDGEAGQIFRFNLQPVPLGMDMAGKEITSCVVKHLEPTIKSKTLKLPGACQKAIYAAIEVLTTTGQTHHPAERFIAEAMKNTPYDPTSGKRDRRKNKLTTALKAMVGNYLQLEGGLICLPQYHKPPQLDFCGNVAKPSGVPQTPHDSIGVWQRGADAASVHVTGRHRIEDII